MRLKLRSFALIAFVFLIHSVVFAAEPVIEVISPANNSTSTSPVNFVATATSSGCAKGISAMRVYSAPNVTAYTVPGGSLNAWVNLNAGTYNTTIVAWDGCGGTATAEITVTANGKKTVGGFLYTANSGYLNGNTTNNVVGFSIVASNGALAPLLQGPVNTNIYPFSVASDKGGYRLYVGDYESGDVFPYFINRSNGFLTPVPGAPFPVNRSVMAVAVHPSGDWIYAAANEQAPGDGIAVFQLQSDGSLKEISGSPFPTQEGPLALTVDPLGSYLYVVDWTKNANYIEVFQINRSTGALSEVSGSPYAIPLPAGCNPESGPTAGPNDIIDVLGKWIYTPDELINYISGWSITSNNGELSPISSSPWIVGTGCPNSGFNDGFRPYSLAVNGAGKFLYLSSNFLQGIAIYSIGSDGSLTYVNTIGVDSSVGGFTPVRTDTSGKYLYTGGPRGIAGYSINSTTGNLTPIPGSPFTYYDSEPTQNYELDFFAVTP